ncbi:Pre-mRNA-splicing factor sap61 [Elasticomyces elasticus]|nr:Pre-mRNA-splicing factor sap61 [Elasticomyces elasticus]
MSLEDQRSLHEEVERLEAAISEHLLEEPRQAKDQLARDHQIRQLVDRAHTQSGRLLSIYNGDPATRTEEIQSMTYDYSFESFYKGLEKIKDHHKRYPNQPVENLERAYKPGNGDSNKLGAGIDNMFTGEEAFGKFLDLNPLYDQFLNLPGVKGVKHVTYLTYLTLFDIFTPPDCPVRRLDKMTETYFDYVRALASYLQSFMRKIKPLEDLDRLFTTFDQEFSQLWEQDNVPGWETNELSAKAGPIIEGTGEGVWCADCEKTFKTDGVYKGHLAGRKHIRAAEARKARGDTQGRFPEECRTLPVEQVHIELEMYIRIYAYLRSGTDGSANSKGPPVQRLKERAVAELEFRVRKLASAMQTEREDTRVNVERKQGMTDRERAQEIAALYAESSAPAGQGKDDEDDSDGEKGTYNPLKLPLAWDGKPIPFWLYKLHGLGVEFPCEVCGNFVYMGRRAFDKHFSEHRHIHGLKCLGITNTSMFREITGIEDATNLWAKMEREAKGRQADENVVEMEDGFGNVMPVGVWKDLARQGLLGGPETEE